MVEEESLIIIKKQIKVIYIVFFNIILNNIKNY